MWCFILWSAFLKLLGFYNISYMFVTFHIGRQLVHSLRVLIGLWFIYWKCKWSNAHVKYKVLSGYTWNETKDFMVVNIGWRWQIDKLATMKSSSLELRYTNKGGTINQHAFKGNLINFAQNYLESAIKLLNTSPSSLESLIDTIAIHFFGSSHPPIELVKKCRLLYVRKYIITI